MAQPDEQRGACRQREQDTGESEKLSECEQCKNHCERMQADAITHQPGDEHITFEQLSDAVDREHGEEPWPPRKLKQRRNDA